MLLYINQIKKTKNVENLKYLNSIERSRTFCLVNSNIFMLNIYIVSNLKKQKKKRNQLCQQLVLRNKNFYFVFSSYLKVF